MQNIKHAAHPWALRDIIHDNALKSLPLWVNNSLADNLAPSTHPPIFRAQNSLVQIGWFPLGGFRQNTGPTSRWSSYLGFLNPRGDVFSTTGREPCKKLTVKLQTFMTYTPMTMMWSPGSGSMGWQSLGPMPTAPQKTRGLNVYPWW